jgi:hypothetical protein
MQTHVERDARVTDSPVRLTLSDGDVHVSVVLTDAEADRLERDLADVVDRLQEEESDDGDRPRRSEPADFGGGESTGVQDLLGGDDDA